MLTHELTPWQLEIAAVFASRCARECSDLLTSAILGLRYRTRPFFAMVKVLRCVPAENVPRTIVRVARSTVPRLCCSRRRSR
jgi:hypothetical protein